MAQSKKRTGLKKTTKRTKKKAEVAPARVTSAPSPAKAAVRPRSPTLSRTAPTGIVSPSPARKVQKRRGDAAALANACGPVLCGRVVHTKLCPVLSLDALGCLSQYQKPRCEIATRPLGAADPGDRPSRPRTLKLKATTSFFSDDDEEEEEVEDDDDIYSPPSPVAAKGKKTAATKGRQKTAAAKPPTRCDDDEDDDDIDSPPSPVAAKGKKKAAVAKPKRAPAKKAAAAKRKTAAKKKVWPPYTLFLSFDLSVAQTYSLRCGALCL